MVDYADVLQGKVEVGRRAAIIGAGGIGFDVAEFLVQADGSTTLEPARWRSEWGVDLDYGDNRGGLVPPAPEPPARELWLLQRSQGKLGARLGKTTGWIHRATLKHKQVVMISAVEYLGVDDTGLHVKIDGKEQLLEVDHIVVCAGQLPFKPLAECLDEHAGQVHVIGGAELAAELDAKRAIDQGCRLAATF